VLSAYLLLSSAAIFDYIIDSWTLSGSSLDSSTIYFDSESFADCCLGDLHIEVMKIVEVRGLTVV
jgi:hypothetical protein